MKQPFPTLKSDEAADAFVEQADLTQYDLSRLTPVHFEFLPKAASVTMRLSEPLLAAIKEEALRAGIPYQRFIRKTLEAAVGHSATG